MKTKPCKHCKEKYEKLPDHPPFRNWCSIECAIAISSARQAKQRKKARIEYKRETRARKEKLKSKADYLKEAQTAVNSYIRARDKGKPCISCGKPDIGVRNASHYRSAGACSSLRFNTWNIHASCYSCNCSKSGNLLEYRIRLIKLIGVERVEWLESQNEITRYDVEYLKRLKAVFTKRARQASIRGEL